MILDYSTARPSVAQLQAAGVTAVGRYIGWDSVPGYSSIGKNLTRGEREQLHAAGIAVFVAFEYAPDAPRNGAAQGDRDGQLAAAQLAALGAPPLTGVYFACDWDIPDYAPSRPDTPAAARAKLGPAGDYFAAIAGQHPPYRVGVYGGYWAVSRVLDAGLATLGWQTSAWSGGLRDQRAQLYQTADRVPFGGSDFNVHEGSAADFGQWAPGPAPAAGHPVLSRGATGAAVTAMQQALDGKGAHLTADGDFGPATLAALVAFQAARNLTPDGVCGPLTWAALGA